jgi:hypothetical protein
VGEQGLKRIFWFRIADKNIGELASMDIKDLITFLTNGVRRNFRQAAEDCLGDT